MAAVVDDSARTLGTHDGFLSLFPHPPKTCVCQAEYGSYPVMVAPEYRNRELKPLNDRFCLAEACLVADVVQHLQDASGSKAFHPR